ncbi:hypothetical protein B0H11DRAFT_756159 [Mycena galericulata]|nr:hypothetical protein B0H11DRAFT_756159 [Mycena galericulata]
MAPQVALPNVQLLYGPMLVGVCFNMILYGVLVTQMLTYHQSRKRDTLWLRILVTFLFCVETANTVLDMAMMYQPLILEYGQQPVFFPTVLVAQPLSVVLVSMPIQIFFAWRIYQLTTSLWIFLLVSVLALANFAGGLWTSIRIYVLKHVASKVLLHNSALLWLLSACAADVIITLSLVITLKRKKTGFRDTDSVVDKIIRATIQTGLITALFSIFDVVCFTAFPGDTINFIWDIALSNLYANCLLSTLNARQAHALSLTPHFPSFTTVPLPAPGVSGKSVMFVESAFECTPGVVGTLSEDEVV